MPTSTWVHISTVADEMHLIQPTSILDVGIGDGRWAFIAREVLELIKGKVYKKDWKVKIEGIEVFKDYITPVQEHIYDKIYIEEASVRLNKLKAEGKKYDLVICGDVIEHFPRQKAKDIINTCFDLCNKEFIVGIPLGDRYPQGTVAGNVWETHQSVWSEEDFKEKRIYKNLIFKERIKQRPYGLFFYKKA